MKSLHISIHEDLYKDLLAVVKARKTNRTEIVRQALEAYIKQVKQQIIFNDMRLYAETMAEYSADFINEFDASATELLASTEW